MARILQPPPQKARIFALQQDELGVDIEQCGPGPRGWCNERSFDCIVGVDQQQYADHCTIFWGDLLQELDVDSVSVAALYNYKDGKIYVLNDVDISTTEGKGVLLHELVHYLRYRHGVDKSVACMGKLEHAAYRAQANYLREHGQTPEFDELHVLLASSCLPML